MQAASPGAEVARDFLSLPVKILGDGDGRECGRWRPSRLAQRSRGTSCHRQVRYQATATAGSADCLAPRRGCAGLLVVAGRDAGQRRQPKALVTLPGAEVARDFLSSTGEMPGDGDGWECRRCRPHRLAQRSHGTSCCLWTRCRATATADSAGCLAPQGGRAVILVVAGREAGRR